MKTNIIKKTTIFTYALLLMITAALITSEVLACNADTARKIVPNQCDSSEDDECTYVLYSGQGSLRCINRDFTTNKVCPDPETAGEVLLVIYEYVGICVDGNCTQRELGNKQLIGSKHIMVTSQIPVNCKE